MGQLQNKTVGSLSERKVNIAESWVGFTINWGGAAASVSVLQSAGSGYQWTGSAASAITNLSPNTFYLCLCSLRDTTARLQIYNINQTNYAILPPSTSTVTGAPTPAGIVFDTGPIKDSYLFPRRAGRIGWQANFLDGDAQIRSIRPHALVYAEYRTTPLNSNTPVRGARIYARTAPQEALWQSWTPLADHQGNKPRLTADTAQVDPNDPTNPSARVDIITPSTKPPAQGIISNVLTPTDDPLSGIVDWTDTVLSLSLWLSSSALPGSNFSLYLLSQDGYQLALTLPALVANQWQALTLYPSYLPPGYLTSIQSGRYQLVLSYIGSQPTTFWVDNVQVIENTMSWDGRANPLDPWTAFEGILNSDDAGALFNKGTALEIRARAHRQDETMLAPPNIIPIYAPLGRRVWPENAGTDPNVLPLQSTFTATQDAPGVNHYISFAASAPTWSSSTAYQIGQVITPSGPNNGVLYYLALVANTNVNPSGNPATWEQVAVTPAQGVVNYQWSFGDGTVGTGQNPNHAYTSAGTYTVTLTISDAFGTQSSSTGFIAVT